jgi:hypothetical protein
MASQPVALKKETFAQALALVVDNAEFSAQLEQRPGSTLKTLGFQLPPATVTSLDAEPLSTQLGRVMSVHQPHPEFVPMVVVDVGVVVAVRVVVESAVVESKKPLAAADVDRVISVIRSTGVQIDET